MNHKKKKMRRELCSLHKICNLKFHKFISHKPLVPLVFSILDSHSLIHLLRLGIESFFIFCFILHIYISAYLLFLFYLLNNLVYLFTYSPFLLPLFKFKFLLFFLGLLYLVSYPSNPFYIFLDLIILPPSL